MSNQSGSVSKDELARSVVSEAQGLHKQMLGISSAFLGGSILFLEKIAPNPEYWTLVMLIVGWLSLISSMALSIVVRLNNIESGRRALEGKYDKASELDRKKECWTKWAVGLLIAGILLIAVFGAVNIANRAEIYHKENSMSEEQKKDNSPGEPRPNLNLRKDKSAQADGSESSLNLRSDKSAKIVDKKVGKGSIPFGSMGPQETQPAELSPSEQPKPDDASTNNETTNEPEADSNKE